MKKVTFGGKPTTNRMVNSPDEWVAGEPTKRLTIDIPLSLHQRVKSQCALEGANMAEVVRGLLEKRFPPKEQGTVTAGDPVNK
jgi:hypothetical protein